jgi:DNA-binding transcriptional LysR family regulator
MRQTSLVHSINNSPMPAHPHRPDEAFLPGLDLNLLRIFAAVHHHRQVTAAARVLDMTPSAVSNALARLRAQCGDQLFVRTQRGVVPTPYAERLSESVTRALQLFRAGLSPAEGEFAPAQSERVFRINLADVGQMLMIGEVLTGLAQEAPGIGIRTTDLPVAEAEQALMRGDIDLAVGHIANMGKSLFRRKLVGETFVCVVGQQNRRYARRLTLDDYLSGSHIRYTPAAVSLSRLNTEVDRIFRRAGRKQRITLEAAHSFGLSAIVAQTEHILTVPARLAAHYTRISPVLVHPLPIRFPPFDISLYWHERDHRDAAHKWFRSKFAEMVKA